MNTAQIRRQVAMWDGADLNVLYIMAADVILHMYIQCVYMYIYTMYNVYISLSLYIYIYVDCNSKNVGFDENSGLRGVVEGLFKGFEIIVGESKRSCPHEKHPSGAEDPLESMEDRVPDQHIEPKLLAPRRLHEISNYRTKAENRNRK